MLFELTDKPEGLEEALKLWFDIKNKNKARIEQACQRTVSILRTLGKKELVEKYSQWVFDSKPEIGLKLFTEGRTKLSEDSSFRLNPQLNMTVEEVL